MGGSGRSVLLGGRRGGDLLNHLSLHLLFLYYLTLNYPLNDSWELKLKTTAITSFDFLNLIGLLGCLILVTIQN